MYQKVREYVRRHRMLDRGDKVIVGVSGGADSICLLFMLMELQKEIGFSIVAVHVHHGIRGKAADEDAAYVEEVCERKGIGLRMFHENAREFARKHKMTEEEAGREIRRACFCKVLQDEQGTKVALAHHQDDNAETLVWNLCRGCGLKGLGGIAPAAEGWIRPLLCLRREEIEAYLEEREIPYCMDASNLEDGYTRNRIRRHVIPYLEESVNGQAVSHMSETMERMRVIGEYMERETRRYAKKCVRYEESGGILLDASGYCHVPEALRGFLIHEALCSAAGKRKDIEAVHIKMVEGLFEKQVGRQVCLPYNMRAIRRYGGVELSVRLQESGQADDRDAGKAQERDFIIAGQYGEKLVEIRGKNRVAVRWRIFERKEDTIIFPENPYTKWFDYDIIKSTVKIRHREPGDYITISKQGGTQKLKQYFINEKVPGELRDSIWLAADGAHIMWIVGYRQNQKYQITEKTRKVLEIEFYGGENNGGECQGIDSGNRSCKED